MAERHRRCHLDGCLVHYGEPRPAGRIGGGLGAFSPANRREMAELHRSGWPYADIAEDFGTWPTVVGKIVRAERAEEAPQAKGAALEASRG